jgi:hypothetical protein
MRDRQLASIVGQKDSGKDPFHDIEILVEPKSFLGHAPDRDGPLCASDRHGSLQARVAIARCVS